jgi:membrane protein DedA with SNARE-associated domain
MTDQWIPALAERLPELSFFLAIAAPVVGGELAVLGLAFLAGQGYFPLLPVVAGSFLGMLALDAFWFMVPRSPWGERLKSKMRVSARYQALEARIEAFAHRSDILVLFISKVLIGTRILVLAYLSIRSISFWRFLLYDMVATALWAVILGALGWFAGLGYYNAAQVYNQAAYGVLGVALAAALFYAVLLLIRRWFTKSK